MARQSFEAICACYRENGCAKWASKSTLPIFQRRNYQPCGGKAVPAEIKTISIKEQTIMVGQSVQCEVCGELKSYIKNHEKMVRSGCTSCRSLIRKRPEAVVRLLLEIHGEDYPTRTQRHPAVQLAKDPEPANKINALQGTIEVLSEHQNQLFGYLNNIRAMFTDKQMPADVVPYLVAAKIEELRRKNRKIQEDTALVLQALQERKAEVKSLTAHIKDLQQKEKDIHPFATLCEAVLEVQKDPTRDALVRFAQDVLAGRVSVQRYEAVRVCDHP